MKNTYRLTLVVDFPREPSHPARQEIVKALNEFLSEVEYLGISVVTKELKLHSSGS